MSIIKLRRPVFLAGALFIVFIFLAQTPSVCAINPTQTENRKAGTSDWQLSDPATGGEIEGYASLTSVNRGGQISLFVHTLEPSYTIEIFRMGWYGGSGARRMTSPLTRPSTPQPIPTPDPQTGLIECHWSDPFVLQIPFTATDPTDWMSGIYLAKLTASTTGKQSYIIFDVRDDERSSDLLVQSSVTTYELKSDG